MKIAKRIADGWTPYMPNKSTTNCDDCGARLWAAPGLKSFYCNAVHKVLTEAK